MRDKFLKEYLNSSVGNEKRHHKAKLKLDLYDYFNGEFKETLKGLIIFLILPVIFLYLMRKLNEQGEFLFLILYWLAILLIYKYKKRSKIRTWQLAQFLSNNWSFEKKEEERMKLVSDSDYMLELKSEYPEIFIDGLLEIPKNK